MNDADREVIEDFLDRLPTLAPVLKRLVGQREASRETLPFHGSSPEREVSDAPGSNPSVRPTVVDPAFEENDEDHLGEEYGLPNPSVTSARTGHRVTFPDGSVFDCQCGGSQ